MKNLNFSILKAFRLKNLSSMIAKFIKTEIALKYYKILIVLEVRIQKNVALAKNPVVLNFIVFVFKLKDIVEAIVGVLTV